MKNNKWLPVLLASMIFLSVTPLTAFAETNKDSPLQITKIEVPADALFYENTVGGVKISGVNKEWFRANCGENDQDNPAYLALTIPAQSGNSKVVSIGISAFCTAKATDPNDKYNYIHPSYYKIVSVDFSQAENLIRIEDQAFLRSDWLGETITLPESLKTIGKSAFSNCTSLKGITLPADLKEIGNSNSGSVFMGCTALEYVRVTGGNPTATFELPKNLESIGSYSFKTCFAPSVSTPVTIPASVKYIGSEAFMNSGLTNNGVRYLPITTIIVKRQDLTLDNATGVDYNGKAFSANASDYGFGKRIAIFNNYDAISTFNASGGNGYLKALTFKYTMQFGTGDNPVTESKLHNQPLCMQEDPDTGDWTKKPDYTLPVCPSTGVPAGYTCSWTYNDTLLTADTALAASGNTLIATPSNVPVKPTIALIVDGKVQTFSDTTFDINVSYDKVHQIGVQVTHPLETKDENGCYVYFKYEWTDIWKGGSVGPRMNEYGFGFPKFPSNGTPTIPIDGIEHERLVGGGYSVENYGDGYYLVEIYGYYSQPGYPAELFYKSSDFAIATPDPTATDNSIYIFYVKTSDPALGPIVNQPEDVEVEYGYQEAQLGVSVTEDATYTYAYQWYQADAKGQIQNGVIIDGAVSKDYTVEPGKNADSYYYYVEITATKTENGDTAVVCVPAALKVNPKTIFVLPDAGQQKYTGQQDPVLSYSTPGLPNDVNITGTLTRASGETVGYYDYALDALAVSNPNYQLMLSPQATPFEILVYEAVADFSPKQPNGSNGWYKTQVIVTPPEGHLISLDGENWSNEPIVLDRHNGDFVYWLKSEKEDNTKDAVAVNTVKEFKIDTTAPVIEGVEDGKEYCIHTTFTVTDENLDSVVVNGEPMGLTDQPYSLEAGAYSIIVTDLAGNSVTINITVNATHTEGECITDVPPTCTQEGSQSTHCKVCDAVMDSTSIPATGHQWREVDRMDPTETENGYIDFICDNDETHTKREVLPATGTHNTGDNNSMMWLWFALTLLAAGSLTVTHYVKKKKHNRI